MVRGREMRRFWDERAAEDPFYFVDNRLAYGKPDVEPFWRAGDEELARILDLLGVQVRPGDRILEIGCGIGRMTRTLAGRGARVRALDVSERMLELARELNGDLDEVNGCSATATPWPRSPMRAWTPAIRTPSSSTSPTRRSRSSTCAR